MDERTFDAQLIVVEGAAARRGLPEGLAATPRWSPDGRSIAFLATVGARKLTGATQPGVPITGEIGAVNDEQRIAVIDAAGGDMRLVSPADTSNT